MGAEYKRIALVPAYKPDGKMLDILCALKSRGFILVVVNDGSGSEYDEVFSSAREYAEVITLPVNQGKGCALKAGIKHIRDNFKPPYTVVTIDADGQHRVEDACKIAEFSVENSEKMIIGRRNLKLKGIPLRSRVGNDITHFGFRQATLTRLNETQTGLRAFSDKIIDRIIDVNGTRYEYEMIVLMTLARQGVEIEEIEIETVYEDGNSSSHFNPLPDSLRIYFSIFKFALPAVFCFFIDLLVFSGAFVRCQGLNMWLNADFSNLYLFNLIFLSNLTARTISTVCDLLINKGTLFTNAESKLKVIILYIVLLAGVFTVDTLIICALSYIGIIPFAGKVISTLLITWASRILQTRIFEN